MSAQQFTPGPWTFDSTYMELLDATERCLADVREDDGGNGAIEECRANARLIAAAPELYDGCNALLGLIQLLAASPDTPPALLRILTENHRITEAENAVAKARGEQVRP